MVSSRFYLLASAIGSRSKGCSAAGIMQSLAKHWRFFMPRAIFTGIGKHVITSALQKSKKEVPADLLGEVLMFVHLLSAREIEYAPSVNQQEDSLLMRRQGKFRYFHP
jgi:hypothetical protein